MTETAIADGAKKGAGILRRKVFGVPVLYLAIVFVAVLAFYAWRTKEAPAGEPDYETEGGEDAAGEDFTNPADPRTLYPISPTGTVYAQSPQAVEDNAEYFGNNQWLQKAGAGMVAKGKNPGEVQNALQAYLEGEDLSYGQGLLRDQAIKEYGLPPESFRAGVSAGKPLPTPKPKPEPVKPPSAPKPVSKPAPKPAPPKTKTYTVKRGDTLWDISAKFYNGNSLKWKDIANRNNIRNPRSLQIGRVLVIP